MLDFGLSRLHLDENGRALPERKKTGFRGTVRYASITVHERRDAGRNDDLRSFLYTVVEWFTGWLPWASTHSRAVVYRSKVSTSLEKLCSGVPEEVLLIAEHIKDLK